MFTDVMTIPSRLEAMIDLLRDMRRQVIDAERLHSLMQPDGLPAGGEGRQQSKAILKAAKELDLVIDDDGRLVLTNFEHIGQRSSKGWAIEHFDRTVLSDTQVEPYFAKFYGYMLVHGSGDRGRPSNEWVSDFNRDVFNGEQMPNPFNPEKITGMNRWMRWAGLGWYDSKGNFVCNPYHRIHRVLRLIFDKNNRMTDDAFVSLLGTHCPELDGGAIFKVATEVRPPGPEHLLTAGVAQALLELHSDGVIKLHASQDATGWGLDLASPTEVPERLHHVELLAHGK